MSLQRIRSIFQSRHDSNFRSQVGQDRWVVETLNGKRGGFFVELGASDGVKLSNTFGLEKELDWTGICIEPHPDDFKKLQKQRSCRTVQALVSSTSGQKLEFQLDGQLSGVSETAGGMTRSRDEVLTMEATTLRELLARFQAPSVMDYLSLDVEGHEMEVLRGLFPGPYRFRCITVEHNEPHQGPALRDAVRRLLNEHGYRFVKGNDDVRNWGHGPIDDFYVSDDPQWMESDA